jgi:hypothetical protein
MPDTRDSAGNSQVVKSPVGVEKLFPAKFAKIKSCQDAPQTTFSVFLDIFYPPNSCCFEENGVFQQPRLIATVTFGLPVIWVYFVLRV